MNNNDPRQNNDDLKDSPSDEKRIQPEHTQMDLPEVKDIPGQEPVKPSEIGEYIDTTTSSDDEVEYDVLDDDEIGVGD